MNRSRILALTLLASCGGNGNGRSQNLIFMPGAVGATTLSWIIPTEREDDSPLTNLAGFNVYVGIASGLYSETIRIENPSINVYVVERLDSGTIYYFAVTAFDSDDLESDFSNEVSKAIE